MVSISLPGITRWGNPSSPLSGALAPSPSHGEVSGRLCVLDGQPPRHTQVLSPRGFCESLEVSTSASCSYLLRPCSAQSTIGDSTVLAHGDTTTPDTEPALPSA